MLVVGRRGKKAHRATLVAIQTRVAPAVVTHIVVNHTVGTCEVYKEERNVLNGEMRKIDDFNMEKFGTLLIDCTEKNIHQYFG